MKGIFPQTSTCALCASLCAYVCASVGEMSHIMQMTFMNPLYPRVSHLSMRTPSLWARRTMDLWDAVAEGSTYHFPGQFPRGREAGSWNQLLASWRLAPGCTHQRQPQGVMEWSVAKTGAGRKKRMVDTTTVAVIGVPLLQPS